MLKADKRPPTEADRPRQLSKPPRVLDGQIDIFGQVHSRKAESADEQQEA